MLDQSGTSRDDGGHGQEVGQARDMNSLAAAIVAQATDPEDQGDEHKDEARSVGGAKGGRTRANNLTPERRREIARAAARSRWAK